MSARMYVQSFFALHCIKKALGIFGVLEKWFQEEKQLAELWLTADL